MRKLLELLTLEGSYKHYIEMQETFLKTQPFSSNYIYSIINELEEYKRKLLVLEPQVATRIVAPGLPTGLSDILKDVDNNIQNYTQKYQNKLNEENEVKQIIQDICKDRANRERERQKVMQDTKKHIDDIRKGMIEKSKENQTKINEKWRTGFTK